MGKLSETSAVAVARAVLANYDDGWAQDSDGRWWSVNDDPAYWSGRVAEALRGVLAAIDDAEWDEAQS